MVRDAHVEYTQLIMVALGGVPACRLIADKSRQPRDRGSANSSRMLVALQLHDVPTCKTLYGKFSVWAQLLMELPPPVGLV
jgi:hypothetical protein